MFNALCKRRNIRFKYECFAHAQTTAAIYNVNRSSEDAPMLTAFDFVRTSKVSKEKAERQSIRHNIQRYIGSLPASTTAEKFQEIRSKSIQELTKQGQTDAEEIWNEAFPSMKPQEK